MKKPQLSNLQTSVHQLEPFEGMMEENHIINDIFSMQSRKEFYIYMH